MAWLGLYHPLQEWGETLIAIAVRVRCKPLCKKLVSRLPKDQRTRGCGCALIIAAKQGDENLVRFLVQEGNANVNLVARGFTTALCEACVIGALNIVKYLVEEAQANVDVRTECDNYISALAAACHSDSASRLELVKYLLEEAGAVVDPPLVSGLANSTLGIASSIGPLDLVKYLVEKGNADVNLQLEGWRCSHGTALADAVIRRRLEIIKYLVTEVHADVNQQLRFGHTNTALTTAVETGSRDIVQLLVEEGNANINLQSTCGGDRNFGSTLEYAIAYSSLIELFFKSVMLSSGSSANLLIPESHFRITSGSPKTYSMTHESGMNLTTRFCENCGSLLYKTGDREGFEGAVIVLAGTLDNTEDFEKAKPEAEFFVKHRVGWWPGLGFATQLKEFE
ncbi:ankyrin repeat-containing domain protein [Aspergillus flavus]|uniref:Ankyrin repeat-containing domain protein n=1 Tax=Aspergillus flavus TaxID=5059 RepID=A0A5N6GN67_ASPFL|nr:ankyrin repeat-containing domain protein [Aspergillus flavus]